MNNVLAGIFFILTSCELHRVTSGQERERERVRVYTTPAFLWTKCSNSEVLLASATSIERALPPSFVCRLSVLLHCSTELCLPVPPACGYSLCNILVTSFLVQTGPQWNTDVSKQPARCRGKVGVVVLTRAHHTHTHTHTLIHTYTCQEEERLLRYIAEGRKWLVTMTDVFVTALPSD